MELKYNDEIFEIEAVKADGLFNAKINGEDFAANARMANENTMVFRHNGKTKTAYIASDDEHFYAFIDGRQFQFDKVTEEELSFEAAGASADREEILPPMPGSVVKLECEAGQKVSAGDALIIVEAMKMETALYASIDGVVTEINVEAGQQVDSNKVMIVVEKEQAEE